MQLQEVPAAAAAAAAAAASVQVLCHPFYPSR
jgi:hypothetical protein